MNEEINIFAIVPIEVLQDSRLTLWQIKVLVALLSFRNKTTNLTFPSREQISIRTGLHISNVSKTTSELVQLGWLLKEGKGGFSKATRYVIQLPDIASNTKQQSTVAESTTVVESTTLTVAESTTRTVAESTTRKEQTNLTDQLTNHIPKPKKQSQTSLLDDGFEEFWNRYPKRVGKDAAHKSWTKNKVKVDEVLKALEWQIETPQWQKQDGQFIPNPTTYLNQGRWKDEPTHEGNPF